MQSFFIQSFSLYLSFPRSPSNIVAQSAEFSTMELAPKLCALCTLMFGQLVVTNAEDCAVDVVFVLDSSGSVTDAYKRQLEFIRDVAAMMHVSPDKHRIAFVTYSGKYHRVLSYDFTQFESVDDFERTLDKLRQLRGTTYTGRALNVVSDILSNRRVGVRSLLISVTDGFSHDLIDEPMQRILAVDALQAYAVSVDEPYNQLVIDSQELMRMVDNPDNLFIGDHAAEQALDKLRPELECLVRSTTQRPSTTTDVFVLKEPPSGCPVDLVLIIDASGRNPDLFNRYRDLANQLINRLHSIGQDGVQISIIAFGDRVDTIARMTEIKSVADVRTKLASIEFQPGNRNLGAALNELPNHFDEHNGARRNVWSVKKAAIVFTNGYSCYNAGRYAREVHDRGVITHVMYLVHNDTRRDDHELNSVASHTGLVFPETSLDEMAHVLLNENCPKEPQYIAPAPSYGGYGRSGYYKKQ